MPHAPDPPTAPFTTLLAAFAAELTGKFAVPLHFNPEDQLKAPILTLLNGAAALLNLPVEILTEVQDRARSGRPDVGVITQSLLAGYLELKAPGKGADPAKFKAADKAQWEKFRDLPNLFYTDGNQWALYRGGERIGRLIRLSGDVTADGKEAVSEADAAAVFALLRDFLLWQPTAPATPRDLAETLAPLCRLLRAEVLAAMQDPASNLAALAVDWRHYLFPDADDAQFADAYAQTLTYALLLAQWSGAVELSTAQATKTLRPQHGLLAEALKVLADEQARAEIATPVNVLERVIAAVDPAALVGKTPGDPWLYFYEDFLAVYDPKMRKDRGVYYTPVPVVHAQVALIGELLATRFGAEFSFVDPNVVTLDPAAGTGTYILAALDHALARVAQTQGPGMRAQAATVGARNIHAFEILVGPYAVAHLRLSQRVLAEGGTLPTDGAHVYLTDTLEPPNAAPPGHLPLAYKALGEEHRRAQKVKADTAVLVCLGNPPYDRQTIALDEAAQTARKGGWIRYGDDHRDGAGILQDFIAPLNALGLGLHAKNLYNDYVYFWRWALWKVFESKSGPGIVGFITAASYLAGPGFAAMRRLMRQTFDDLWILDLEGDNLGARKTDNVFAIQTPVAIAIGTRYGEPRPDTPATVHYSRIEGSQAAKFERLSQIERFADVAWKQCSTDWTAPFLPLTGSPYFDWPLVTDLFPWQENGVQFKRSWPIGETVEVLEQRWRALLTTKDRRTAFKESRDRKVTGSYPSLADKNVRLPSLASLEPNAPMPSPNRYAFRSFDQRIALLDNRLSDRMRPDLYDSYAFRSFDRRLALFDNRVGDYLRPTIHHSYSDQQIFLTSLLTAVLGHGPAAVATALIPDLHHFCNRGAKDVIPLWRDATATQPNIASGLLEFLNERYGQPVSAEDLFAYAYALLATPEYVNTFWDELALPGPRLPLTQDPALFAEGAALGRRLIWLHTYGERCIPPDEKPGRVPPGLARCQIGTPSDPAEYPERFDYDPATQELRIGKGRFAPVRPEIWTFSISGFEVVKSWLAYRMRDRSGKKSSPLDDIRPQRWEFDEELLKLLWVLDHTIDLQPALATLLQKVRAGALFAAAELPVPAQQERDAVGVKNGAASGQLAL